MTPEEAADKVSTVMAEVSAPFDTHQFRDFLTDLRDRIQNDIDAHQEDHPEAWKDPDD